MIIDICEISKKEFNEEQQTTKKKRANNIKDE